MNDSLSINRIPDTADYPPPKNRKRRNPKENASQESDVDETTTDSPQAATEIAETIDGPDHLGTQVDLEV